jgi:hypothetical protein
LRVLDLYGEAERREEPAGEELDALDLVQSAGSGQERLKTFLVLLDGPRAMAVRQLEERRRT